MEGVLLKNAVFLCGRACSEAEFSHENHGERFFRFPLAVSRLSRQIDCLSILATQRQLESLGPLEGRRLTVEGQLRSVNNKRGQGSKLVISVLGRTIQPAGPGGDVNRVELSGVLCKPPVLRRTPLGRCICDIMLAVNRRYGRADYLPCIAWGQVAMLVGQMEVGQPLSLEGRIQSREYTKLVGDTAETRTAFEVSIMQLAPLPGEEPAAFA